MSQTPYTNEFAERTVLASSLSSPESMQEAMSIVAPEHFSLESHRVIWAAAAELAEKGKLVDLLTLSDHLSAKNLLTHIGGVTYLSELDRQAVRGHNIAQHARIVLEKAKRRTARVAAERLLRQLDDQTCGTAESLSDMQEALFDLEADSLSRQACRITDFIADVFNDLKSRSENKGLVGMSTGIEVLDFQTTGFRPQELWICGALPGNGKTSLGIQAAIANASKNIPVCIFSLEMSRNQIGERILAASSSVSASRIREPRYIGRDGWPVIAQTVNDVCDWPLYVDDSDSLDIQQLIARATLAKRRFGIQLFIVDYIKLVRSQGKELRERVSQVAESLRRLAKREHVAVLALSQLSRPKDKDINSRPSMLDLKESGDLEAAAHVVILNYRPRKDDVPTGEDEIIVGKQREGGVGPVKVRYNENTLQFDVRK